MKASLVFILAIGCFATTVHCRDPTYQVDLYAPVQKLKEKLVAASDFNLTLIIGAVVDLVTKCLPPSNASSSIETILINFDSEFSTMEEIIPMNVTEDITNYMNSTEFKAIHNYLWAEPEWLDLIETFYKYGWNSGDHNIYVGFQKLYEIFKCPLEIPDPHSEVTTPEATTPEVTTPGTNAPPPEENSQQIRTRRAVAPSTPIKTIFQDNQCHLADIIITILEHDLLEVIDVVKFVVQEVESNPSIHLLWATITEPAKGQSFRKTRNVPEVKQLIKHWDTQFKENELVQIVIQLLETVTGIDFSALDINVIENIISIIEFMIWRTPFPVPTA